ncbi:MAG: hypothetical protein K2K53_00620 [Oscillospiraceae bacterium]|nr:hypothetical protein [Oscillospiraceae bacterium]
MECRIEACDLAGAEFTAQEIQTILSAHGRERLSLLLRGRGRLLNDIHQKQQALDRLDYFVYQIRQGNST